ncbi:phosphoglycerate mutase [Angomonas deanei]|nr:phosphoglycerate mutase [Angomonas deanei]|eukprot:EPY33946.1 phosphoglycerate mutase [Angomonas deanei]
MATVYVCRHGQDLDNLNGILNGHRNEPLSELGQTQAKAVADKIKEEGVLFDAVYVSPLQRARQTAEAICERIGMEAQVRDDLIERNFGVLSGKPYADIPKYAGENILQGDNVLYFLEVEGGESSDDCFKRAQRVLEDVDRRHAGKNVLLVCHGDIGKMLLAVRRGVSWREGLLMPYFANTEVMKL